MINYLFVFKRWLELRLNSWQYYTSFEHICMMYVYKILRIYTYTDWNLCVCNPLYYSGHEQESLFWQMLVRYICNKRIFWPFFNENYINKSQIFGLSLIKIHRIDTCKDNIFWFTTNFKLSWRWSHTQGDSLTKS